MIYAIQIGFGPLGIQTANFIAKKEAVKTVAVVDINPDLTGKTLAQVSQELSSEVLICSSVESAITNCSHKPDVAIITTVSSLEKLIPQIEEVAQFGIPVVSTCEELSYPWETQKELSIKLDAICKK